MASRNTKTKQRKTELKRSLRSATTGSTATGNAKKGKSSEDLNEVAARLIQQSELNTVNHAAAHLIRKSN